MTLAELLETAQIQSAQTEGLRYGQAFYNLLHTERPDLADLVRGTALDPFYTSVTQPLLDLLAVHW